MTYEVNYNGANLSDYCKVLNVERTLLPSRTNLSKSIPTMNGSYYTGFHYGERIIKLEILINETNVAKMQEKIRKIKEILNTSNPSKLIISDEPDKYVYAVLDGDTDFNKIGKTAGSTTINFICHNPIIYSDKWNTFTPGNKGIITVENNGTIQANPLIDVIFRKKACFFQATNRKGETVLIGSPKEIGKATTAISDIIVEDNCTDASTFTTLTPSLLDTGRVVNGGSFGVGFNGNGIVTLNYGSGSDSWHGSAFRKSLGSNVDEFEVTVDVVFSSQGKNYEPPTPVPTPPEAPPETGNTCLGTYKVVNCGGLWINGTPDTSQPLYAMSPGTLIYPTEIRGNWAKHTHSNKWNTFTGWSSLKYLQKISDNGKSLAREAREEEFAENELGLLEVYGFDNSGAKLFKAEISDASEWFEYTNPKMYIGTTKVLEDNQLNNTVRTETDSEGNVTNLASGAVGRWNDLTGKIVIRREKNAKGEYLWNFTVNKYNNGALVETLETKNSLVASNYPKGSLNYLGFFIGGYGDNKVCDVMAITNVKVKKLNVLTDAVVNNNLTLFEPNDQLQVDFASGEVLLNGVAIPTQIDIGSNFFELPTGESQFAVRSDDDTIIACCGVREKFI